MIWPGPGPSCFVWAFDFDFIEMEITRAFRRLAEFKGDVWGRHWVSLCLG